MKMYLLNDYELFRLNYTQREWDNIVNSISEIRIDRLKIYCPNVNDYDEMHKKCILDIGRLNLKNKIKTIQSIFNVFVDEIDENIADIWLSYAEQYDYENFIKYLKFFKNKKCVLNLKFLKASHSWGGDPTMRKSINNILLESHMINSTNRIIGDKLNALGHLAMMAYSNGTIIRFNKRLIEVSSKKYLKSINMYIDDLIEWKIPFNPVDAPTGYTIKTFESDMYDNHSYSSLVDESESIPESDYMNDFYYTIDRVNFQISILKKIRGN